MIRDLRVLAPVARLFLSSARGLLLTGVLLSVVAALSGMLLLGLSGWFITATALAGTSMATAFAFDVFAPAAAIRFLALTRTAARYGERLTTHDAALRVLATLRERLFRGWADIDSAFTIIMSPARALFRLTLDLDALDSLYLRLLVPAVTAATAALLVAVAIGMIHPLLGFSAGIGLLLAGFGIPVMGAALARRSVRRHAYAMEILRSRVVDLVSGQTELVMAGRLNARREAIASADRSLAEADAALNKIELAVGASLGIAGAAVLAAVLVVIAFLTKAGSISTPVAVLVLLVASTAFEPFAALRRGAVEFGRTVLAARRTGSLLMCQRVGVSAIEPPQGFAVRLDRISAGYPGGEDPVLRDVSLVIREGERVALIGASGAGKSTLLSLIAGELAATSGRVERRRATLLTQRTQLFQDTLRDNLRLADPQANDAVLLEALDAAGLRNDIMALPYAFDSRLGEGGLGLSGGQARRLALARLFLRDTALWLLDEPTEGLDGRTARDILARLEARASGRTVVVATHIRREAEMADRLVIMNHGIIAAIVARDEPGFMSALASLRPD